MWRPWWSWLFRKIESPSKLEPEWCTIGTDVLEEITKRLETRIDILRLRAVCKDWRSSIPFPSIIFPNVPFNLQLPPNIYLEAGETRLLLKESTLCSLQHLCTTDKKRQIVKIEHTEPGKVLLDQFLKFPFYNLGKTNRNVLINLSNYEVRELGKEYSLGFVREDDKRQTIEDIMKLIALRKVIVGENKEGKIVVMIIHKETAQIWKMGTNRWVEIDHRHGFQDIAYHKGRFYAVDNRGETIAVEYSSSLRIVQVACGIYERPHYATFLAKSRGGLYLIDKKNTFGCLDVFKLDEELGQWIPFSGWLMEWVKLKDGVFYDEEIGGCKDKCSYFRHFDNVACLTIPTTPTSEEKYWD